MIPKIINYVWLSNDEKPEMIQKCINTWKKILPEYEIREWKSDDFDFSCFPVFVQEAYSKKKWAFVTDYLRLYILYNFGGIYLDSDIFIKKSVDEFLDNGFFSFVEYHPNGFKPYCDLVDKMGNPLTDKHIPGLCIQAAFMGAEKKHPFVKSCMDYYENIHYINENGTYYEDIIAPDIYALCARKFGFKYKDELQLLDNRVKLYPSAYVAGSLSEIQNGNYAVHCCAGSWRGYSPFKKKMIKIIQNLKAFIYLR
jgi:hypothetical protein